MKRLWILALVILVGIAVMLPTPVALADPDVTPVIGDEPVLIGPEFCPDVTGDGVVDIADVVTVVKGYGTVYYITDIGAVAADYGRVGLVCL